MAEPAVLGQVPKRFLLVLIRSPLELGVAAQAHQQMAAIQYLAQSQQQVVALEEAQGPMAVQEEVVVFLLLPVLAFQGKAMQGD